MPRKSETTVKRFSTMQWSNPNRAASATRAIDGEWPLTAWLLLSGFVSPKADRPLTTPSPRWGEGYAALVPQALRRSWMRGVDAEAARNPMVLHPHPASTRQQAAKSAQPSPSRERGKKGQIVPHAKTLFQNRISSDLSLSMNPDPAADPLVPRATASPHTTPQPRRRRAGGASL